MIYKLFNVNVEGAGTDYCENIGNMLKELFLLGAQCCKINIGVELVGITTACVFTIVFFVVEGKDLGVFVNKRFTDSAAVAQRAYYSRYTHCFRCRCKFSYLLKIIVSFCCDCINSIGQIPSDIVKHIPASFSYFHFPYKLILSHFMTVCKHKNRKKVKKSS